MPRVSVIIPVYNGEEFIEESLDSVFSQTFRDFEVIVVNDGSTDGTADVLRKYDNRLVCLTQPNRGQTPSRMRGLHASSGQWIAFLDADDIWLPGKLARQLKCAELHPDCGIVTTDVLTFRGHEVVCKSLKEWYTVSNGYVLENLLMGNWITPSAAMVRRECLEKITTFDLTKPNFGEDWLMWMQIVPDHPVHFVDEVLVRRRIHSQNVSRQDEEAQFAALLRNFDIVQKAVPALGARPRLVRNALYNICINRGRRNLMALNRDLARDKFRRATRYKPSSVAAWLSLAASFLPLGIFRFAKTILAH